MKSQFGVHTSVDFFNLLGHLKIQALPGVKLGWILGHLRTHVGLPDWDTDFFLDAKVCSWSCFYCDHGAIMTIKPPSTFCRST